MPPDELDDDDSYLDGDDYLADDDDCFCEEPLAPKEETADKELPEATGGIERRALTKEEQQALLAALKRGAS